MVDDGHCVSLVQAQVPVVQVVPTVQVVTLQVVFCETSGRTFGSCCVASGSGWMSRCGSGESQPAANEIKATAQQIPPKKRISPR